MNHTPKHTNPDLVGIPASRAKTTSLLVLAVGLVAAATVALAFVGNGDSGSQAAAPQHAKHSQGVAGVASTAPDATPSASAPTSPSTAPSSKSSLKPVGKTSSVAPKPRKAITYTVKRGDNLTGIAQWFKLHGYGDLYERNMKVIGADPDLIFPGQTITISPAGARLGSS